MMDGRALIIMPSTTSTGRTIVRPSSWRRAGNLWRAARLLTRPRRHSGTRPADPRAVRPDAALRGQHRDPESHCRFAPRAAQQLRALAALREAGRMGRAGPRVPAGLLRATARVKTHQFDRFRPPALKCTFYKC